MRAPHRVISFLPLFLLFSVFSGVQADQSDLFDQAQHAFRIGNSAQAAALYEQMLAEGPEYTHFSYNLGICYKRLGEHKKAIAAFERAIALHPQEGDAYLNCASCYEKMGEKIKAGHYYALAADLCPAQEVSARYLAATMYREAEQFERALGLYAQVVVKNPSYVAAHIQMGNVLNDLDRPKEAIDCYFKAVELDASNIQALYNFAFTLKRLNMVEDALELYNRVLDLKPDYAAAYFGRSMCHLLLGNLEQGFLEYEWRWKSYQESEPHRAMPRWQGGDVAGKTILLHAEQGLGDTLQFVRYAQILKQKGARVIVQTQQPLEQILKLCPYIDAVVSRGKPLPVFDLQCPMMSLPLACGTTRSTIPASIPYLYADEQLVAQWRAQLAADTNVKVGICWQGNPNYSTSALRRAVAAKSLALSYFADLSHMPGVTLYSLQKMSGEDQLAASQVNVVTFDGDFDGSHGRFMDTAAVIKNLDLVITVDTSISHLAGALGARTWVLLPNPGDWRWMLNCSDTPWYATMRLFRQPEPGNWRAVMQDVAHELEQLVAAKKK